MNVADAVKEGLRHHRAGRLDDAEAQYRRALAADPDQPDAHHYLGVILHQRGRHAEAARAIERAIALGGADPAKLNNLGEAFRANGDVARAERSYRRAVALDPRFADAHGNLGLLLLADGRPEDAETSLRASLAVGPNDPEVARRLAQALHRQGRADAALAVLDDLLARFPRAADDVEVRREVATVARVWRGSRPDAAARRLIAAALAGGWGAGESLAEAGARALRLSPETESAAAAARRANAAPLPEGIADADRAALRAPFENALGAALMTAAPLPDALLETVATALRRVLLGAVAHGRALDPAERGILTALAVQAFANEYVWAESEDETAAVEGLATQVAGPPDGQQAADRIVAVGAYRPLHAVSGAADLTTASVPEALRALIALQVEAPRRERAIAAALPAIGTIQDPVSRAVRAQYEENPYPRWLRAPPAPERTSLGEYLRRTLPHAPEIAVGTNERVDILIAGCGTGRQVADTARRFAGARVLAVDLSRASLAYAARMTADMGVRNVEYAQADILGLDTLERRFDSVESGGVLHHMADPAAGLGILAGLLKPGGVVGLALYSAAARRDVVAARDLISTRGFAPDLAGIRRCRQAFFALAEAEPAAGVLRSPDFYSTSACRDLLFHVHEVRFDVDGLARLLAGAGLAFLGFEAPPAVAAAFRRRFPAASAAGDLSAWKTFEDENRDAFARMYHFWARKID